MKNQCINHSEWDQLMSSSRLFSLFLKHSLTFFSLNERENLLNGKLQKRLSSRMWKVPFASQIILHILDIWFIFQLNRIESLIKSVGKVDFDLWPIKNFNNWCSKTIPIHNCKNNDIHFLAFDFSHFFSLVRYEKDCTIKRKTMKLRMKKKFNKFSADDALTVNSHSA